MLGNVIRVSALVPIAVASASVTRADPLVTTERIGCKPHLSLLKSFIKFFFELGVCCLISAAGAPATAQTFNQIQLTIATGGADLRGDCEATATLETPSEPPCRRSLCTTEKARVGPTTPPILSLQGSIGF